MKKKVIEAWMFAENDGYGVSTKCTHEEALEAIKVAMRDYDDARIAETLKLDDVKPSRLYKHRHCDVGTIGSTDCYDCGEPHMSNGRPIFVWHRTKSLSNFSMTSNDKAAGCCPKCEKNHPFSFTPELDSIACDCDCHLPSTKIKKHIEELFDSPTPRTEKKECHSCGFERNCEQYKGAWLCKKCAAEAIEDAKDTIVASKPPTDSEDDAIEAIVKEFEEMKWGFSSKYGKSIDSEWLRTVLRSYGDMREEKGEKKQIRPDEWLTFEERAREEGRREATLEFSKISGGYESGKRAALNELVKMMEQRTPLVESEILSLIAEMKK